MFNPFPHTTILQQTTLNIFCQNIENLYNWMDNLWLNVENIVAKGEIARFEQFLFLSLCFQKAVCCRGVRKRTGWSEPTHFTKAKLNILSEWGRLMKSLITITPAVYYLSMILWTTLMLCDWFQNMLHMWLVPKYILWLVSKYILWLAKHYILCYVTGLKTY